MLLKYKMALYSYKVTKLVAHFFSNSWDFVSELLLVCVSNSNEKTEFLKFIAVSEQYIFLFPSFVIHKLITGNTY